MSVAVVVALSRNAEEVDINTDGSRWLSQPRSCKHVDQQSMEGERAMRRRRIWGIALSALMLFAMLPAGIAAAATGDPVLINEVLASHSGTDDTEFVELFGTPGLSLEGLSVIVVEGDEGGSTNQIDFRYDFGPGNAIGANGFFLLGNCGGLDAFYGAVPDASIESNSFENSSATFALVETGSLSGGVGSLINGEVVRDAVGLLDSGAADTVAFGAPAIGPDGSFFPAGARRIADGVDTDAAGDWVISSFSLPGDNTPTGGGADGCVTPVFDLTIPEIQGDGLFSPYGGEMATTTGIVTLITANGRDMWIQDPAGDGDPATSDGIFVDDRDRLDPAPQVGDLILVTAEVEDQQFGNALPRTRLNNPDPDTFEILSSGNPLPRAVRLSDLPNESIAEGIEFWSSLEGMLVFARNGNVVAATSGFGEFGFLTRIDSRRGSGYVFRHRQIFLRELAPGVIDYNPERILVDDASVNDAIQTRPGDKVVSLTGVVDYTFGAYKLQPVDWNIRTKALPREPVSRRTGRTGDTTITTFNVENLFDLVLNPDKGNEDAGSTPTPDELNIQLTKLATAIGSELRLPEIIVTQEGENEEIVQALGDKVNAWYGTDYVSVGEETSDARGIEVGFLYDADRVTLLDYYQLSGADVEAAYGPDSPSPGREPLYGMFEIEGEIVHIVGVHFKSKGGDDPPFGLSFNRITEVQRKLQAQVVRDFVDSEIFSADPDALVMVAGDMNDFQFGEPGEGLNHTVAIVEGVGGGVPLKSLLYREQRADRFTFIFDGNSQVLDHILVSPTLWKKLVGVDFLHFNASYPAAVGDDGSTAIRASDHDPIEGRFVFVKRVRVRPFRMI
jgi:hypothetical protein